MTIADIIALGKMGYTKADIDALMERENAAGETKSKTDTPPAEPAKTAQDPAPKTPDPAQKEQEAPKAAGTEFDRLMARLDALTAQMQENNRLAADMGANIIDPRSAGIAGIAALSGYEIKKEE